MNLFAFILLVGSAINFVDSSTALAGGKLTQIKQIDKIHTAVQVEKAELEIFPQPESPTPEQARKIQAKKHLETIASALNRDLVDYEKKTEHEQRYDWLYRTLNPRSRILSNKSLSDLNSTFTLFNEAVLDGQVVNPAKWNELGLNQPRLKMLAKDRPSLDAIRSSLDRAIRKKEGFLDYIARIHRKIGQEMDRSKNSKNKTNEPFKSTARTVLKYYQWQNIGNSEKFQNLHHQLATDPAFLGSLTELNEVLSSPVHEKERESAFRGLGKTALQLLTSAVEETSKSLTRPNSPPWAHQPSRTHHSQNPSISQNKVIPIVPATIRVAPVHVPDQKPASPEPPLPPLVPSNPNPIPGNQTSENLQETILVNSVKSDMSDSLPSNSTLAHLEDAIADQLFTPDYIKNAQARSKIDSPENQPQNNSQNHSVLKPTESFLDRSEYQMNNSNRDGSDLDKVEKLLEAADDFTDLNFLASEIEPELKALLHQGEDKADPDLFDDVNPDNSDEKKESPIRLPNNNNEPAQADSPDTSKELNFESFVRSLVEIHASLTESSFQRVSDWPKMPICTNNTNIAPTPQLDSPIDPSIRSALTEDEEKAKKERFEKLDPTTQECLLSTALQLESLKAYSETANHQNSSDRLNHYIEKTNTTLVDSADQDFVFHKIPETKPHGPVIEGGHDGTLEGSVLSASQRNAIARGENPLELKSRRFDPTLWQEGNKFEPNPVFENNFVCLSAFVKLSYDIATEYKEMDANNYKISKSTAVKNWAQLIAGNDSKELHKLYQPFKDFGWEIHPFTGTTGLGEFEDIPGFIAHHPGLNLTIVTARGSSMEGDRKANKVAKKLRNLFQEKDFTVHGGMGKKVEDMLPGYEMQLRKINSRLNSQDRHDQLYFFTGHSQGAVNASLLAYKTAKTFEEPEFYGSKFNNNEKSRIQTYVFASPQAFTPETARKYNQTIGERNSHQQIVGKDFVTHLGFGETVQNFLTALSDNRFTRLIGKDQQLTNWIKERTGFTKQGTVLAQDVSKTLKNNYRNLEVFGHQSDRIFSKYAVGLKKLFLDLAVVPALHFGSSKYSRSSSAFDPRLLENNFFEMYWNGQRHTPKLPREEHSGEKPE